MNIKSHSNPDRAIAIARKLKLTPIPSEGGYFSPTFRSPDTIESPKRLGGGPRLVVSVIYFMLFKDFNAWHRMRTNEVWCYHGGATLTLHQLREDGSLTTHKLGDALEAEENEPQVVIEAGSWMASELANEDAYTLVTCCVTPAFEVVDYEFANRDVMCAKYPQHADLFRRLVRVKANSTETDLAYASPPLF